MRVLAPTAALIGVLSGASSARSAADLAEVKRAIQAQYHQWEVVAKSRDPKRIRAVLEEQFAPEFIAVDDKGLKESREQNISEVVNYCRRSVRAVKRLSYAIGNPRVDSAGRVTIDVNAVGDITKVDDDGKAYRELSTQHSDDTWKKTAQGWKIVRSVNDAPRMTIDGKPPASPPRIPASETAAARKAILASYEDENESRVSLDPERYAAYFDRWITPDYVAVDVFAAGRKKGRDAIKAAVDFLRTQSYYSRSDYKIRQFTMQSHNRAEVLSIYVIDSASMGADGRDHRYVGNELFRDVWVKTPKGWKDKLTQNVWRDGTVDGKRVE